MASRARRSDRPLPAGELGRALSALLSAALPALLPRQRWFGAKDRRVASVAVVDLGLLGHGPDDPWLTVVEAAFVTGAPERYAVPVVLRADELSTGPAIGRLDRVHPALRVYDAFDDPEACLRLLAGFAAGEVFPTERGRARLTATAAFPAGAAEACRSARRLTSEQSNTSVAYDAILVLKAFRRVRWGVNPDCEVTGFLTTRTDFRQIPRLAGSLDYTGPEERAATLAMLQQYVPNEGDGWTFTLDHLSRFCEVVRRRPWPDVPDPAGVTRLVREVSAGHLGALRRLGALTGGLHAALASGGDDPAFAPEAISSADVAAWTVAIAEQGQRALAGLRAHLPELSTPDREVAEAVLGRAGDIGRRARGLRRLAEAPCDKARIHGDYHLGQTLRTADDFVIFDFEGEPARPLAERRTKQSPLKDVAGMLRSLDYAVAFACRAAGGGDWTVEARLRRWGEVWRRAAEGAFLEGYRGEAARSAARLLPTTPSGTAEALAAFELDKACYELAYELDNRPSWVSIPLRGLARLLTRSREEAPGV